MGKINLLPDHIEIVLGTDIGTGTDSPRSLRFHNRILLAVPVFGFGLAFALELGLAFALQIALLDSASSRHMTS